MIPFVADPDFTLYVGDVREVLAGLPDGSVDCVATSPPFYALRDYGTGTWRGGDSEHEHDTVGARGGRGGSGALDKRSADAMPSRVPARTCSCGAEYHDPQIGLEETPELWVEALVGVFAECRRVLSDTGTLWVECGDSYNAGTSTSRAGSTLEGSHGYWNNPHLKMRINHASIKTKDLMLTPMLLALALRADGWWLRQVIIWHKPNAMPESATDRCTTAHSYVFLLSKSARYHFDAEAIAEPAEWARWGDQTTPKYEGTATSTGWMAPKSKHELVNIGNRTANGPASKAAKERQGADAERRGFDQRLDRADGKKNPRSVWTIPTQGYSEAHFATWPEALVERIIKAGCPEGGTVLDPFMGSGTTALVARKLGRKSVGIELNPSYAELCAKRLQQLSLLAEDNAA